MYKTKVTNASENTIILKEGNAGVYSLLGTLDKEESMILSVSPNATYREYWFAVHPGNAVEKIILTSDDCMEYKEVKIVEEANKIGWTGTLRNKSEPGSKSKGSVIARMLRIFLPSEREEPDKIGDKDTEDKEDPEGAKGKSEEHKEDAEGAKGKSEEHKEDPEPAGDKDAEKIEASGIK